MFKETIASREGSTPFRYPEEEDPQADDCPPIDKREVQRMALSFMFEIKRFSRTRRAGDLRLAAAEYLVRGSPYPHQIAKRFKVTKRSVFQAIQEVKRHVGLV